MNWDNKSLVYSIINKFEKHFVLHRDYLFSNHSTSEMNQLLAAGIFNKGLQTIY